jgi:DNA polymerase (family 10)
VGDLDIVCVPLDRAEVSARAKRQAIRVLMDGAQRFSAVYHGDLQLDLFYAHAGLPDMFDPQPSNLGAVTLYSTGSKDHNVFISQLAIRLGLEFDPWRGLVKSGRVIAGASEQSIYAALSLPYLDPPSRETRESIYAACSAHARAVSLRAISTPQS